MRLELSLRRGGLVIPLLIVALASSSCLRSPEAKSAAALEAGKKLMEQKDTPRAILQFRNAVQATPRNPEVHYQLALAYLAAGDARNGIGSLRRALELNPQHAGARFRLADLMAQLPDLEVVKDAKQRLEALLQDAPGNADTLHTLAFTELKLGELEKATRHLEQAIAAAPQELAFAVSLAEAKLQQKDPKGAESVLTKAIQDFPKSADALVILGRFYAGQNNAVEAERRFRQAISVDPNHGAAVLNLATLLYQTGRKQDAEPFFKRLSSFSDKALQPAYANYLFQEGRRDEALKEVERLVKQDPDDRVARTRLVAAYQSAGRLPDGQKLLSDALKKNQKDLDALLQRGELYIQAGKYAEAEADLNSVLRLKPDAPEIHYALSKLYQARGGSIRQREELTAALRLNPLLLQIRLELAASLIRDKAAQAALDTLDQAPEDQKRTVAIIEQRNWAFLSTKQSAEARKGVDLGLAKARTPDLLLQDAILKIDFKRYPEARQSLREILGKNPEDLRALRTLVGSYMAQNQLRVAVNEVRAYAVAHPKSADVQYFLGNLLLQTGDRTQAKQALATAKAINPNYAPADMSLAQIDLLESNWKDARQELTTILSTKGENPFARQWLGMLEAAAGDKAAAIADFRKVIQLQPDNAKALNNLAFLLVETGDRTEEPLKFAERAKELEPDNPDFEDTLGWVLYSRDVYELAVKHLETSFLKKPTPLVQYHLAMAYFKKGDGNRGKTTLDAALRGDPKLPEAKLAQQVAQEAAAKNRP